MDYFDSYGFDITTFEEVIPPNKPIAKENCTVLQNAHSFVCGNYCLNFLYSRAIGIPYEKFMSKFRVNSRYNDRIVKAFTDSIPLFSVDKDYGCISGENVQTNKCKVMCPHFSRKRW